ncbi:MAG: NapC/NirT family cytochrome c [Burkholderiales bacterium]|nr:NapC/NirT family cytochrome c [Burkholderiales bacterium]
MKWWTNLQQRCKTCSRVTLGVGVFIVALIFAGAFTIAGAAGLAWTNTEHFCIGCHEMRENVYKEFQGTIHDRNRSGVRAICANCHVPHEPGPMLWRKVQATWELWGHLTGEIDTREKFEAHRYELAKRVWTRMVQTDSLECRNCHKADAMESDLQSEKARARHAKAKADGETCIECHFGIAHTEPEGELGPKQLKAELKKAGKM